MSQALSNQSFGLNQDSASGQTMLKTDLMTDGSGDSIPQDYMHSDDVDFIESPTADYRGYYQFGRVLGQGSFGKVVECRRKCDDKLIALKFFKLTAVQRWISQRQVADYIDETLRLNSEYFSQNTAYNSDTNLPSEVACLIRASKIPGVIRIVDYLPPALNSDGGLDDDAIIGIVLERSANECCLFDYLHERGCLSEPDAKHIMKQIVEVSIDLLRSSILHGDLKSENILIDRVTKKIKIIDFGSAQLIDKRSPPSHRRTSSSPIVSKPMRIFRGTNLYKPPEYQQNHCFHPRPLTVWTLGIILYDMVCGEFPFDNDLDVMVHLDKAIEFRRDDLSPEFVDLVKRCLAFYVADRIIIEKILTHKWMAD